MMKTTEKEKERMRRWYQKNREYHINNVLNRLKATKYATEKTPLQKKIRYIKRRTRQKFPIENNKCFICDRKATQRHHYTRPIEITKFVFCCDKCHPHLNKHLISIVRR